MCVKAFIDRYGLGFVLVFATALFVGALLGKVTLGDTIGGLVVALIVSVGGALLLQAVKRHSSDA